MTGRARQQPLPLALPTTRSFGAADPARVARQARRNRRLGYRHARKLYNHAHPAGDRHHQDDA